MPKTTTTKTTKKTTSEEPMTLERAAVLIFKLSLRVSELEITLDNHGIYR